MDAPDAIAKAPLQLWRALKSFWSSTRKTSCRISNEDVIIYNNDYMKKLSASYQNQVVNIHKSNYSFNGWETKMKSINSPSNRMKLLPNVLEQEIKLILDAHSNIKHK
jgi:integrase/recombinase XerD